VSIARNIIVTCIRHFPETTALDKSVYSPLWGTLFGHWNAISSLTDLHMIETLMHKDP
jgi:hypothetical protein